MSERITLSFPAFLVILMFAQMGVCWFMSRVVDKWQEKRGQRDD